MDDRIASGESEPPSTSETVPNDESEEPPSRPKPGLAARPAPVARSRKIHRFPISPRSDQFRRRFFGEASAADWNDWRWQARNRVKDLDGIQRILVLSEEEREAIGRHTGSLPLGITPYYLSLFDREDPAQPLRRTHMPALGEYLRLPGEADDPLGEDHDSARARPGAPLSRPRAVPGHRLLLDLLPLLHARRMVGEAGGEYTFSVPQWEQALAYLEEHPEVRDVLLSGGDPLTLATTSSTGCSPGCARFRTSNSCASAPRCRPSCRSGSRRTCRGCCASTIPCG